MTIEIMHMKDLLGFLQCEFEDIAELMEKKEIPYQLIGKTPIFIKESIFAWISEREVPPVVKVDRNILNKSLKDLPLLTNTYWYLERGLGIKTVRELLETDVSKLRKCKNIGEVKIHNLKKVLKDYGYSLKGDENLA